ncbi:MAG: hypothetical protein C75L2_00140030 [Leptospirillum sp. Group II 'C75']|nr:MAG: conserved hypothetical protein [Leptospirillum rubarum]EIJ75896.1 MAG: hypothetical protein C75L2_00140030 [Leptospirillum sp. Group II 'C75']
MGFVDKASTNHNLPGGKKCPWKSLFLPVFCTLFLFIGGREAFAEDSSQDLTPPSAFEKDENHDLVPDLLPLEPAYLPWGPNTSGPFFTGTAEVEPVGSFFLEPYWFDYLQPGIGFSSLSMPERLSVGLIQNWEFDISVPFVVNQGTYPTTPAGQTTNTFGMGDTLIWIKNQLTSDGDVYHFWARPALTVEYQFTLPTGHFLNLNPQLYGVDQTGDGTFDEGVYLILRKHFKPFMFYLQVGDIIENPTQVGSGFTFNNGLTVTQAPQSVVNGNLLYYAGAFEHVVNDTWGAGYLLEFFGESQSGQSLLFGAANAPAWSYFWLAPEVEVTWPYEGTVTVTWGAGVALPVYQSNYPQTYTPMGTVTIYYNGPFGYHGE